MFSETVDPTRERRMGAILQLLLRRLRGPVSVLDLGSGPGTLAARVLDRLPESRVVAVDTDPVLLRIGAEALHRYRRRVAWVLADLRAVNWPSALPRRRFDAAISSLALHWLEEGEIRALYRDIRLRLRPGGVLVNGDFLPLDLPRIAPRTSEEPGAPERRRARVRAFRAQWKNWWESLVAEPAMRGALRDRQTRMPGKIPPRRVSGPKTPLPLDAHRRALRAAGFREVSAPWQEGGFCVLVAVR